MAQKTEAPIAGKEQERAELLFREEQHARYVKADEMFGVLMVVQWVFAIALALLVSPYAWSGRTREIHPHLFAAMFMGGGLATLPVVLAIGWPGWVVTRHVLVASQMLWSALLIHLTGGRIETHFHVFGSLAFVAFYLDWRLLVTCTLFVAGDHLARGVIYPESVYGIANPEWWRFLEHAGWVIFEDVVLAWLGFIALRQTKAMTLRQAQMESLKESEQAKTAALEMVLKELRRSELRRPAVVSVR